jgi:hypothetical protein
VKGPGGQPGNHSASRAAGSHPEHQRFGQATPGPGHHPTTPARIPGGAGHSPIAAPSPPVGRRSRWSARSEARTNDLKVRRGGGHTRPRGRPGGQHLPMPRHSARRPPHAPRKRLTEPLDTKRLSLCSAQPSSRAVP